MFAPEDVDTGEMEAAIMATLQVPRQFRIGFVDLYQEYHINKVSPGSRLCRAVKALEVRARRARGSGLSNPTASLVVV